MKKIVFNLGLLLIVPSLGLANVTYNSITLSNSNPSPGSVVAVTVVYNVSGTFITPFFTVGLNPSTTTLQACPAINQTLLVDGSTGSTGNPVVNSSTNDPSDGGGWSGQPVAGALSNPYTQVWNVTIPSGLSAGAYNLIVQEGDYYSGCDGGGYADTSAVINVPYPPANITLNESPDGSTANPLDLVLFNINYNYVNTGPVTITATVPTAFVALAGAGGNISPGGTLVGNTITWVLPATLPPLSGQVWFLTQVNAGVAAGTVITNSSTASSASAGMVMSNQAQVNIGAGGFQLVKSESAATLNIGDTVTYTLSYQVNGESLQHADTYANDTAGTANNAIQGWNGAAGGYTETNSSTGGFTVQTDAGGNNYIQACASNVCNSSTTVANFPTLLRNNPGVNLCNNFMVEGDLQIPAGSAPGADATMVIADNLSAPGVNDAYMVGISLDCGPGNFFMQRNQSPGSVTFPVWACNAGIGTVITAGVWYTVKVLVTYVGTTLNFQGKVWPRGTAEPAAWSLNFPDASPLPCVAINGGKYQIGWQADGSSSTDYFANLKLYGPAPVVNPRLWDTLPTGETFISSSPQAPTSQDGNYLEWDLGGAHPVTSYNLTGAVTLSASVSCGAAPINVAAIMGDAGASMVSSNSVTLSVNGCFNTPTNTPTNTATNTATNSPTRTPTNSPTLSPTNTPTSSPTNSPTVTPTNSPTNSPTVTPTPTITKTPTITSTPTNSPTITPTMTFTPVPIDIFYVDKNLFNPKNDKAVSIIVEYNSFPGAYNLRIYNTAGEHIKTLGDQKLTGPVSQIYTWDGTNKNGDNCASGVYIFYLIEPFDRKIKRVLLVR